MCRARGNMYRICCRAASSTPTARRGATTQPRRSARPRTRGATRSALAGAYAYLNLPPPGTHDAPEAASDSKPAPFATLAAARAVEHDLADDDYPLLLTGATGLPPDVIDTRIANYEHLGPGVFPLTPSVKYDDYAASPVHRFYQMWQQSDCNVEHASAPNPSGCLQRSVRLGGGERRGRQQRQAAAAAGSPISPPARARPRWRSTTCSRAMRPYLKQLADRYTLSDNMHQSVQGGTGANHIMFGFADAIWYSDGHGHPATPPASQIENPDPQPGTNNWYDEDGYTGGSYSACADLRQPGVAAVVTYLQSLPRPIDPHCEPGHYYLLNNYNPGFNADGTAASKYSAVHDSADFGAAHRRRADGGRCLVRLLRRRLEHLPDRSGGLQSLQCLLQHLQSIPVRHRHHDQPARCARRTFTIPMRSTSDIGRRDAAGGLDRQAERFVDGHPASSKLDLFEGFLKKIVDAGAGASASCGETPRSSSPSMKAAATTTRATSSRSTSSVTARAFRC